jgi:hypothetical protein
MRKLVFALALLTAASSFAANREVHKTLPLAANGTVSLSTHNGTINVTTWNQPSIAIDAVIEPGPMSSHPEDVNLTEIRISGGGASVNIESNYDKVPEHSWFGIGTVTSLPLVRYTLRVPASAQMHITNHNADTRVVGLRGDVRVRTHNGDTVLRDFDGAADVDTHNGKVDIEYARYSKPARVDTHNGDITLTLPADARFSVHSVAHHGDLRSDFPMAERASAGAVTGSVNGGGPEIRVSAHNGALRLRRR